MAVIRRANNQKMNPQGWGGMKNILSNVGKGLGALALGGGLGYLGSRYPKETISAVGTVLGPGTSDEKTSKLINTASEMAQPYIPKLQKMFGVTK